MDQAGICIGVIPGCGGCGASTLTVALGLAGARHGDVLLVDADPWGQGLGLSLGWDGPDQAGWNLIAPDTEQLDAQELRAVLPQDVGFWVLAGSGDSTADVPEALAAVVAAARNGFDVTVVDLGRTAAGVAAARRCDAVVLVLPTTLAGVLGARRILEQLEQVRPVSGSPIRVVLACRDVGGLTPDSIAEYLGHDVALVYRSSRLIRERASVGELVQGRSGRKLASWGRQLLEVLA
jgi:secretion/DNA translocation related CpaE-like protein